MRRITQAEAQRAFTFALETLSDIDRSPLKRLREEFYPEWRSGILGPGCRDGRYVNSAQRERLDRAAPGLVERWASACRLLTPGSCSAQEWLIHYAVEYLKRLPGVPVVSAHPQETEPPKTATPARVVGRGALFLPMPNPEPLPAEKWPEYRRRVCRVLRTYWDAAQRQSRQQKKTGPLKTSPSWTTKIEHAEWFILYQCCGWKLARIAACPRYQRRGGLSADQTIFQGIQRFAKRTGLQVLAKRPGLNKSAS